jgi:DNA primase
MSNSSFVDFRAVKAAITMEQVLEHYCVLDRFKRSGDSLSGPCPIHKGENPTQFRVSVSKNIWNCFSECKHGGNVLDFIVRMENCTVHAAALKGIEWFGLDRKALSAKSEQDVKEPEETTPRPTKAAAALRKSEAVAESAGPNKPLKFRLDKLEKDHPSLKDRGLTCDTIEMFGIGYCTKGMMADRIAIPIMNPEGEVVAYAGRAPGEPSADVPKYKLPQGFRKSLELFNVHRVLKETTQEPLVIVEGFFDCMKLHQHGIGRVVALMGSVMSGAQEELIKKCTNHTSQIVVMLDEDEAGRLGREDIAVRLAKYAFVKIHVFDKLGTQPDRLTTEEMNQIFGGPP